MLAFGSRPSLMAAKNMTAAERSARAKRASRAAARKRTANRLARERASERKPKRGKEVIPRRVRERNLLRMGQCSFSWRVRQSDSRGSGGFPTPGTPKPARWDPRGVEGFHSRGLESFG
jgi:hypothetical protein